MVLPSRWCVKTGLDPAGGNLRAGGAAPLTLARFEENAGASNTSTVWLEGNAAFGVERTAAVAGIMP